MAEKKCRYCGMMIPKEAKICPHCRKTQGWTMPAKIFLGLIVLAVFGSFMGENASDTPKVKPAPSPVVSKQVSPPDPRPTPKPSRVQIQQNLTLGEWSWSRGEHGTKYIVGTVSNNTPKTYSYAQISFILYDEEGAQIGSAWTNISNLEPDATWKFKAIVLDDKAVKAKFAKLSCF